MKYLSQLSYLKTMIVPEISEISNLITQVKLFKLSSSLQREQNLIFLNDSMQEVRKSNRFGW